MPTTKESKFSAAEQKRLQNALNKATDDIIEKREEQNDTDEYYATEGQKRYICIVQSTRKGEKQFELTVADPKNTSRPIILRGRTGVRLESGLPMTAINALQESYDYTTEEKEASTDPNVYSDTIFTSGAMPRYSVNILGEVKDPIPLGKKNRPKSGVGL